ncbi:MAG: restriction endonuclease [Lachnospiraceae bacterium]|nr:restriction endonuclease [Lachnospiraceae bacterium]MCM1232581.1 restriction endonuclease [Ruminococcus flavefaciens]
MLGQVFCVTENVTGQIWELGDALGHPFEDFIVNVIRQTLYEAGYLQKKQANLYQTPGSNDGGRDIIITSKVTIADLFGFEFPINEKSEQKIVIECKSSENGAIDYNKLSGGIQRAKDQGIDAYVVVTNTTLVPYCYYQLQETAAQNEMRFVLVDQYILAKELIKTNNHIGNYLPPEQEVVREIKYQVLTNSDLIHRNCEIYFLIRNYSNNDMMLQIFLASNWNWQWECENDSIPIALGSHESTCVKIRITRNYNDGQELLQFTLQDENDETIINLQGVSWDSSFLPPLCGQKHLSMIQTMQSKIMAASEFQMFFLHGEAGVGKTRVIEQLCLELECTAIDYKFFSCSNRQKHVEGKVKRFCIDKKMIPASLISDALSDVIAQIRTPYKKYVFIIDDIHNAEDIFYEELKKISLQTLNQPVTLILLGRDDYASGGNAYFNFLSYTENHESKIQDYSLAPLEPDESLGLIRSILNNVPEYAIEQIFKLSNNIPLFIVQFAEYLLDLNLAHIVNRTSVSLNKSENFALRNYLPKKVEKIYEKRFKYIQNIEEGDKIQEALIGLSFFGLEFPQELAISWETNNVLNYLFEHSFLVYSKNENIRFVHESMYLYFRHLLFCFPKWKKKIAKKIINEKGLPWYSLKNFEQARLLLWVGDIKGADYLFAEAYPQIDSFDNLSSAIIDPEINDYLYDIYLCKKKESPFPKDFAEKLFQYKAYVSLHYTSPAAAVEVCTYAEREFKTSDEFNPSESFQYTMKALEAHSYLNMGFYQKGLHYLHELLAMTLSGSNNITQETFFDLYDRLASTYLKYNQEKLALEYNNLSQKIAETLDNSHLLALSSITKAKTLFLSNFTESQTELSRASNYLSNNPDPRILCHNNTTCVIADFRAVYDPGITQKYNAFIKRAKILLDESLQNNYANSIMRLQLFLGTLFYLNKEFTIAAQYISQGINSCIKFGYGTYLWHFYNLRAILATAQKQTRRDIQNSFETVYRILRQQNLLFLGNCDFTYENMIALTNIALFYIHNEQEFYRKLSRISTIGLSQSCDFNCQKNTCQYVCEEQTQLYIKEKRRLLKHGILFAQDKIEYPLFDPETNYFFLLS